MEKEGDDGLVAITAVFADRAEDCAVFQLRPGRPGASYDRLVFPSFTLKGLVRNAWPWNF